MSLAFTSTDKMRIKLKSERKIYAELDKALVKANKQNLTCCKKSELHSTRTHVEQIITKLVRAMKEQSPTFSKMYYKICGIGSAYEGTKIGKPDEFDIDIVLKIPEVLKPVLLHKKVAGFAQIQLSNFEILANIDSEMHRTLKDFVDKDNYILSENMMLSFVSRILTEAMSTFPSRTINVGAKQYKISKAEYVEPALTLTIEAEEFLVSIDLVASFLLDKKFWPYKNYRRNPCPSQNDFFLTPARPIEAHPLKNRFWRLSFHMQERQILFDRQLMKPALRVLKRIRDYFKQTVYSYVIKTIFLWELHTDNCNLHTETPSVFKSSLSFVVIYMLEKYLRYLTKGFIPHFWNADLNLLSYLSDNQIEQYRRQVSGALDDITKNPHSEKLFKYLN